MRLFDEVQARTRDLTEVAAAADRHRRRAQGDQPLGVRSADRCFKLLWSLLRSFAMPTWSSVTRPKDGGSYHYHVASFGFSPEWFEAMQSWPLLPDRGTLIGRTLLERRPIHIPDVLADPEYTSSRAQELGRFRAVLGVPLLRDGAAIGVFMIARRERTTFHRKTNRTRHNLCRPGGYRHRECSTVRRGSGAHGRTQSVSRRATGAGRSQPGGEFDRGPRNRLEHDRR